MARIDKKFIKGTIGPVVYKKYRKLQVMQGRPTFTPESQTKGTKEAASAFGIASKLAMSIRENLYPMVTDFFDGTMVNRLNSEIIHILNQSMDRKTRKYLFNPDSFNRLNGFEFNMASPVRDNFLVQPVLSLNNQVLNIHIPEIHVPQSIKFPRVDVSCRVGLAIGFFDLNKGRMRLGDIQSTDIKYNFETFAVPAIDFDFEVEPGCLCVTMLSMQYFKTTFAGSLGFNTKTFNPVAILKSFLSEGVPDPNPAKWKKMEFKTAP